MQHPPQMHRVPLFVWLNTVVLRKGLSLFELEFNPFVKQCMATKFPTAWIEECKKSFPPGSSMSHFIHDNGKPWDTYTLLKIVQYRDHLNGVFLERLSGGGTQARAYELLKGVVQVLSVRNSAAHSEEQDAQGISEYEVLHTLNQLAELLKAFGLNADRLSAEQVGQTCIAA